MSDKHLIGIDIGTQGTKTAIFNQDGICLAEAFEASQLNKPSPGIVEEDPEKQVASVCNTILECMKKSNVVPSSVVALAIDSQMAGIIGIGRDGRHITPYDSWLDTRCSAYISQMDNQAGPEIQKKTGYFPSFNHGPKILWWMYERPQVFAQIASFVQPGGYAAMRLCGLTSKDAFIDKTYLHFSGFANNQDNCWDEQLCQMFGVEINKLPKIVDSHTIVGQLVPTFAKACGLPTGVPVVAGCGDSVASFLSAGATKKGVCVDVAGTASVFATTTTSFKPDLESKVLGCGQSAIPGLWHPYAYINGGGMNLEWFRKNIILQDNNHDLPFEKLDQLASESPLTPENPLFIPHLGGRVCPSQPNLKGAWIGLNWKHHVGHLYRSILESVALEYGIYMDILRQLYPSFAPIALCITGGGGASALWNQIKSDSLNLPVTSINRHEGAALGSALIAGFGVGLFKDLATTTDQWITQGNSFSPIALHEQYYKQRRISYKYLLEHMTKISLMPL